MTKSYLFATILVFTLFSLTAQQEPPNLIQHYLNGGYTFNEIANKFDQIRSPTDLDFNTGSTEKDLWVINKETENSGGSTIIISDLGGSNQQISMKKDGNAWHFMSLPTGIAFGKDGFFAVSPGVFDANHNGGQPFTGPSLWDSDPSIYAQPSGGNGSHVDMLHESPQCQGIAHEKDNAYWVFDGYNGDIVRYDFVDDHGPGNDYHSDGIIHRYSEEPVKMDPENEVVSHLALDKSTGWLYVVDHGNQRVIRIDINSGQKGGTPSFGPFEQLAEYRHIVGYTWENVVTTDLQEPAGIAVIDNHMLVSDHATGEVLIYDVSSMPATKMGSITTDAEGIMGITIGPDGYIYYVDYDKKTVTQIEVAVTGLSSNLPNNNLSIAPNPSPNGQLHLKGAPANSQIQIFDLAGKVVFEGSVQSDEIETGIKQSGMYLVRITDKTGNKKVIKWLIE